MRALLPAVLVLIALPATGADVASCATIADDGERLACYDALRDRPQPQSAPPPAAAEAPAASPTAAPADPAASFGAEQLPATAAATDKGPDLIESTLIGTFRGWDQDSVFELANGQVWRCVECRAVYYIRENPTVTVKRNFLGSYWLKVEGLNQQARVRRIK